MLPRSLPLSFTLSLHNHCQAETDVCRLCWQTLKSLVNTGWPRSAFPSLTRNCSLVTVSVLVLNAADHSRRDFSFLYFWNIHLTFHQKTDFSNLLQEILMEYSHVHSRREADQYWVCSVLVGTVKTILWTAVVYWHSVNCWGHWVPLS